MAIIMNSNKNEILEKLKQLDMRTIRSDFNERAYV